VIGLAVWGKAGNSAPSTPAGHDPSLPEIHMSGEQGILRARTDMDRSRLWVLGLDGVRVYDAATKKLTRRITLPGWSVAPTPYACMPDLALDRSGSAFISSNATPTIWRIDADSFEVQEHGIRLRGKEQWEIGFGALAVTADGGMYALTSSESASLWRIDLNRASAGMIELRDPPVKACPLLEARLTQFLNRLEGGGKPSARPSILQN